MAEVEISYKGSNIATMNASGTKTLLTEAKYLEDDVTVTYTRPAAPSGTKNISITQNGTTTEDVTAYASAEITANVPNTYSAGDEGKVVSNGTLVAQGSDTVTENDTYDTTLISSLTVNVSGGNIGGLANMVDVSTQNYDFAYMLMCLKNGDSTGGEFRFTTAFPNTSTKIVETGLTEVHGIIFVATDRASTGTGTGVNGMIVIFVLEDNTLFALGIEGTNQGRYSGAQGTQQSATPLQGAVTITDGDVYYKARYNQNAQYQLLRNNTPYEWLAWGVK